MSAEDHLLSVAAILMTAALASHALRGGGGPRVGPPPAVQSEPSFLEERVNAFAEAVAVSEGYYAAGTHDGHSLPYLLNNPGSGLSWDEVKRRVRSRYGR